MKKKTNDKEFGANKTLVLTDADFACLDGKTVLVTGGTGSFGKRFIATAIARSKVKKLIVFSRDELKQSEMAAVFQDERLRFFIGDVRDVQRLQRAFKGVDTVIHAAALKQVPTLEYNPFEAVQTNILGAENIINAAIDQRVNKIVALSTDKAVNPINLYGATKLCAEKLFVAGNAYASGCDTRFSVVRYGNVVGSRGSVIPFFLEKRKDGVLPITDEKMTRFWLTLDQGIALVLQALSLMQGGEIFIPKIPSMRITDLTKAIAPECKTRIIGMRPGEKLHEALLTDDEAARTLDLGAVFLVKPNFTWDSMVRWDRGTSLPPGFRYSSDASDWWLTSAELREMIGQNGAEALTVKA